MAGVGISFGLNDLQAAVTLEQIAAAGEDPFPLMDAIGRVLVNGAVERITVTNIDPDGIAWPQSFRAEVFGGPTLHATGNLARSITSAPDEHQVRVGSNLIYAGVHQDGAVIRPKTAEGLHFMLADGEEVVVGEVTVPRRTYLGISSAEREDIGDLTVGFFSGLLDGGPH